MKIKKNYYLILVCLAMLLFITQTAFAQVVEQDSLALVALYDSTDGANWTNHENWLTGQVSTWHGIAVSGDRVTEVTLGKNNLTGTIPSEIGQLSGLTKLDFYKNQLTGSIPVEIGNLTNLQYLHLSYNQLTGEIPVEIGNLTNLINLVLSYNQLEGSIPVEIGNLTNLKYLYLSYNQLTGEITVEIGNLANLQSLVLEGNQLSGTIPVELANLTKLTKLLLGNNQLNEEIPTEIWNMTNLTVLYLGSNKLRGVISTDIGNLINLQKLWLSNNQLIGEIPAEIGNLINLKWLFLNSNQLIGPIPVEIGNLINLQHLYLNSNKFTELLDLSTIATLSQLDIQNNKFTFEDIEPNIGVPTFYYSPQDSVGKQTDTTIAAGATLTLTVAVGGTANQYQWMKDSVNITGATENTYTIDSAGASDAGTYICKVTNTIATELTIYSKEIELTVEGAVGIEKIEKTENERPTEYALYQNYPNPFNPTTKIKFAIPSVTSDFNLSKVTLKVYDILGNQVTTLIDETKQPGVYEVTFDAKDLPNGVYIYQLRLGNFVQSRKLLLMK